MPNPRTGCLTQLQRGSRLILKLLKGLLLIGCVFPHLRPSERDVIIESWCREVLDVLSVRVNLRGETPPGKVSSVLFVANHVSWMDILVMNACRRVRFVAKTEVRQWPLVGWMAVRTGTIFFKRTSQRELARVTKSIATFLRRGDSIALFSDGARTDSASVHAFHSGLLESAIAAEALIWPVGIRYSRLDGSLGTDTPIVGSQSLIVSIMNVLDQPATLAQVSYTDPIESSVGDRHKLTAWCHQSIEQSLAGYQTPTDPFRLPLRYPTDESLPPLTAAVTSLGSNRPIQVIDRREVVKALSDIPLLLLQAQPVVSMVEGRFNGILLEAVRADGLYAQMGLQSDDVLKRINGMEPRDPSMVIAALQQLKDEQGVKLDIVRNKTQRTLTYDIR